MKRRDQRMVRGEITDYADAFAIDLEPVLKTQVPAALEDLDFAPLSEANIERVGKEKGVYQLALDLEPVYLGKGKGPLPARLAQHLRRVSGRYNISPDRVSFRCLYLDGFTGSMGVEDLLIEHYSALGKCPWNTKLGYGSKVVGRGRRDGLPGSWYFKYPIRWRDEVEVECYGPTPILEALNALRRAVPFDQFTFASDRSKGQSDRLSIDDYEGVVVELPSGPAPLSDHLAAVISVLPDGWLAEVHPVGVEVFFEDRLRDWMIEGWVKDDGVVTKLPPGRMLVETKFFDQHEGS